MRISTKGKYALILLVDIAENQSESGDFVSLSDVSSRHNISKKYLERIVTMLVKPGIIRATRGNKGGYQLNKPPYMCTVGEILRATEGALSPVDESEEDPEVLYVWEGLFEVINKYVDSISLQDIVEHSRKYTNFYL